MRHKHLTLSTFIHCDIQSKRVLWDNIKQLKSQNIEGLWCILGDFNNIRTSEERVGACNKGMKVSNSREFKEWIADLEVEEAPWVGRKFTWIRPNGTARSKLDRFMVSLE